MARAQKANTQSSRLKIITLGDVDKQLSIGESGSTIIITAAGTASRTITLPAVANVAGSTGAHFRIIWGVSTTATDAAWVISTSTAAELMYGTLIHYKTGTADGTDDIVSIVSDANDDAAGVGGTAVGAGNDDRVITLNDDVIAGSSIELVSTGAHWVISSCGLVSDLAPAIA